MWDAILSHFADDCEWLMASGPNAPEGRRCVGKDEIGRVLRDRYEQIPDMRWDDMEHWIAGETRAASEWTVRGTPAGGEAFEWLGCDLWRFPGRLRGSQGHLLEISPVNRLVARRDPLRWPTAGNGRSRVSPTDDPEHRFAAIRRQ